MWCGIRVRLPPPWPRSESWDTFLLVLVKVELRQPRRKERSGKEREVVLWVHQAPAFCRAHEAPALCRKCSIPPLTHKPLGGLTIRLYCRLKVMSAFSEFHKVRKLELGGSQDSSPQPQFVETW